MVHILILFISLLFGPMQLNAMHNRQINMQERTVNEKLDIQILQGKFEYLFEKFLDEHDQESLNNLTSRVITLWCNHSYRENLLLKNCLQFQSEEKVEEFFESIFNEIFNCNYLIDLKLLSHKSSIFLIALQYGREDLFLRMLAYHLTYIAQYGGSIALDANELNFVAGKRLVHYACTYGFFKTLLILRLLKADFTAKTGVTGITPQELVNKNGKLSKEIAEKLSLILTDNNISLDYQLNLDLEDLNFHNIVTQLNSGSYLRPVSSLELISAWAKNSSGESLTFFEDPTPENIMIKPQVDWDGQDWDNFPRTPTRSKASLRLDDATPECDDPQFYPIHQGEPANAYRIQMAAHLPGQATGSAASSTHEVHTHAILAAVSNKLELVAREESPRENAVALKKTSCCTIL